MSATVIPFPTAAERVLRRVFAAMREQDRTDALSLMIAREPGTAAAGMFGASAS